MLLSTMYLRSYYSQRPAKTDPRSLAFLQARPEIDAVCHSHSPYGKAWAVLSAFFLLPSGSDPTLTSLHPSDKPLPIYTQDACVFYNDLALYDTFGGVVLDSSESARITAAIGDKKAIVLSAHGLLTVGQSIEAATAWFIMVRPFPFFLPRS